MDLTDRCAVVTGGGHGIGRALCERLARDGARVVVADVHAERAEKIAARVGGIAFVGDVGDPAVVAALVDRAEAEYGPVHVFCSNAGIGDRGPDLASTPDEVRAVVDVNLLAHVWAAQRVLPTMLDEGAGYLVQTISSAALITGPSPFGYTLTKHGALGFAEWVALNYAHLGITVTCLCPNAVNTGMLGRNEDDEAGLERLGRRRSPPTSATWSSPSSSPTWRSTRWRSAGSSCCPHPRVGESFLRKAGDYDRWLEGTNRRLRRMRGEDV